MTTTRRRHAVLASAALAALALDILTKVAAVTWLAGGPVRLGPLLTLRLVHNSGIAFGVAAASPAPVVLGVTAVITGGLGLVAWRGGLGSAVPAGLIVGGALANVADRATGGSVVDFIDVGRWPTFNLADVLLLTGIALLLRSPQRSTPDAEPMPALIERPGRWGTWSS